MSSPLKHGLIERRGLIAAEISEIKHLVHLCNQHEGLDMKLVWSMLSDRPADQLNDFLYYADGQLVGCLALFIFNLHEAEVSGMVHPAYRQRGIFSALFAAARQQCRSRGLSSLLLIVEHASPCVGYLGHPFSENDEICERMSQVANTGFIQRTIPSWSE